MNTDSKKTEIEQCTIPSVSHSYLEPKDKAESMIREVTDKFGFSRIDAINVNIYAIQTMITYNPISTTPTDRKKAYHKYWQDVEVCLSVTYHCG